MASQPASSNGPSLLVPIPNAEAASVCLVELTRELPLAASPFGLVLSTALDLSSNKAPEDFFGAELGAIPQPHFCAREHVHGQLPQESAHVHVSMSGWANTFYAQCEKLLMRAAATFAVKAAADGKSAAELTSEDVVKHGTSENFAKLLKQSPVDPIIQDHCHNVSSIISNILEFQASERIRLNKEIRPELFYCINDIWSPVLTSIPNHHLVFSNRAVKFIINEEDLLKGDSRRAEQCRRLESEDSLVLDSMQERDIDLMLECNTIKFERPYAKRIIRYAKCFRNKDGDMVAWAGTHSDFSIAALHVLPEYRKKGLGGLVLDSLALMHVRLAREMLITLGGQDNDAVSASSLFAHADCMDYNSEAMVFMERNGWRRAGSFLWLGLADKSIPAKKQD
ncbi:hypothetical protein EDD11_010420 [Mortierella claussenii]|nr:hypothetical protein EDD11_010420 [Mortierella claussenii]